MTVSRQQYFSALAQTIGSTAGPFAGVNALTQLYQSIPADVNDPLWIEFNTATSVTEGDVLATFTQNTFDPPWTDQQMASLFETAGALPGGICCNPTIFNGNTVTAYDIITLAFKDAGILGIGQSMLAEDYNDALLRLNMMIAQWRVKRWLVWHLVDKSVVSTGAQFYTVGPGGEINVPVRPDKLETAYFRMLPGANGTQAVDYPLQILMSYEDYARITLKTLTSFSQCIFYDSAWPMGKIYPWPLPQASLYEIHIVLKEVLGEFANLSSTFHFPPEYYAAIHYNMVVRLRAAYRMSEDLGYNGLAADALQTLRSANAQIPSLVMPDNLVRPGVYNIYSDQTR